jgi:cytochrome c
MGLRQLDKVVGMKCSRKSAYAALALAAVIGTAIAEDRVQSGRQVFEQRCRNCHGGTAPADYPIGPSLTGIIGAKAGTQDSGMHSRAIMDSGIVWNRDSLRRFLSNPQREIPGALMIVRMTDTAELESLLDYLESLH